MIIRPSRYFHFLILCGLSLCVSLTPAPGQTAQEIFAQLRETARELSQPPSPPGSRPPPIVFPERFRLIAQNEYMRNEYLLAYTAASESKANNMGVLIGRLDTLVVERREPPPPAYIADLQYDLALMRRAVDTRNPFEKDALLGIVQASFETRIAHLTGEPDSYVVALSVTTKRRGRIVNGYQIGVVPMMWEGSEPRYSLRTISSPARGEVTPGRYQVIVTRDGREVRRDVHRIGMYGRTSESIEVSVP